MKPVRSSLRGFAALLVLAFASTATQAQSSDNVIVEVALFSQPSARLLPAEPADLDWADKALVLRESVNGQVREIDPARRELSDEMERLTRQGYRLQLHKAWTQPRGLGTPVAVSDTSDGDAMTRQDDPQGVQGLVALEQRNGLEASVSFWLNHVAADGSLVTEHIQHTRRLRLDETHYLDHPSLGALIRVRAN